MTTAPTIGNTSGASSSSGSSAITPPAISVNEASLIVVQVTAYAVSISGTTITDSQNGSYSTLLDKSPGGDVWELILIRAGVASSSSFTVTVKPGDTTAPIEVNVYEIRGATGQEAIGTYQTGSSTSPSSSVTVAAQGDLVLFLGSASTPTGSITYGSGQTGFTYGTPPSNVRSFGSYQTPASTGSISSSATFANSQTWLVVSLAIAAAGPWAATAGRPYLTVSPTGITATGISNDGADFGPDTPGTTTYGIQEAMNMVAWGAGGTIVLLPNNASGGYNLGGTQLIIPPGSSGAMNAAIVIRAASPLQVITFNGVGLYALTASLGSSPGPPAITAFPTGSGAEQIFLTLDGLSFNLVEGEDGVPEGGLYLNFIPLVDSFVSVIGSEGGGQTGIYYLPNNNSTEEPNREFRVDQCDTGLVLARDHVVLAKLVVAQAETAGLQVGDASNGALDSFIASFHLFNNISAEYGIHYGNSARSDVTIGNFVCEEDSMGPLVTNVFDVDIGTHNTPALTVVHLYRFDQTGFVAASISTATTRGAIRILSAQSELPGFSTTQPTIVSPYTNTTAVCQRIYLPFSAGGNAFKFVLTDFMGIAQPLPCDPPFVDLRPGESLSYTNKPGSWLVYACMFS
jgi:hypothetical protein